MVSPDSIVAFAQSMRGRPYWNQDFRRLGLDRYDCSGLCWRSATDGGGIQNLPTLSWTMARTCTADGLMIRPWQNALNIRGCWLFMGPNEGRDGFGDSGHVALTVGDGRSVVETPAWGDCGHCAGTDSALGRGWSGAAYIPGVTYPSGPQPGPQPQPGDDDVDPEAKGWIAQILMRTVDTENRVTNVEGAVFNFQHPSGLSTIFQGVQQILGAVSHPVGAAAGDVAPDVVGVAALPPLDHGALQRAVLGITPADTQAAGGTAADFSPSSGPAPPP